MAVTLNASTSTGLVQSADTSGTIELQSNGTTKATVSSSGLAIGQYNPSTSLITNGTAVATTSGTSINFTGIPSWVKRITISFAGVFLSGSANRLIQIGSGSYTTSGYTCQASYNGGGTGSNTYTTGFGFWGDGSSSFGTSGLVVLTLLNSSTNLWVASGSLGCYGNVSVTSNGFVTLSGVLDRFRVNTTNGTDTFTAGSINILYE